MSDKPNENIRRSENVEPELPGKRIENAASRAGSREVDNELPDWTKQKQQEDKEFKEAGLLDIARNKDVSGTIGRVQIEDAGEVLVKGLAAKDRSPKEQHQDSASEAHLNALGKENPAAKAMYEIRKGIKKLMPDGQARDLAMDTARQSEQELLKHDQVASNISPVPDANFDGGIHSALKPEEVAEEPTLIAYEPKLSLNFEKWNQRLKNFEASLTEKLGHKPGKEDLARIMLDPKAPKEEVLNASILYSYQIRPRIVSLGQLATEHATSMLDRSTRYKAFPENLSEIDYSAIQQNFPDSCPLMSTMIGMARTDQGRVKLRQMIRESSDGIYTVTFPGALNHPISVQGIARGEKMIGASSEQGYLFPAILEKAYGQLMNQSHPNKKTPIASEAVKYGGDDYIRTMELLTGKSIETINTSKTLKNLMPLYPNNQFLEALKKAHKEGRTAIAGIREAPRNTRLGKLLHSNHSYTVTSFNDKTVTLRDPLPGPDRVLPPLTWQKFNDIFNMLLVEK